MIDPTTPLTFSDRKMTTRRRLELMRVNEIEMLTSQMFREIDECVALVEDQGLVEDGECEVEIIVRQKMKVKKNG